MLLESVSTIAWSLSPHPENQRLNPHGTQSGALCSEMRVTDHEIVFRDIPVEININDGTVKDILARSRPFRKISAAIIDIDFARSKSPALTVKVSEWPTSEKDTEEFVHSLSSDDCDLLVFVGE